MKACASTWLLLAMAGCSSPGTSAGPAPAAPARDVPPPVITETVDMPRDVVAGRYHAVVRPRTGRLELHAVAGRASFDYSAGAIDWATCPGDAPCQPAAGAIALYTDQSRVSYRDQNDVCYSNGGIVDCTTLPPGCDQPGVFCAPIQVISSVTHGGVRGALPAVVVQISQEANLANAAQGCVPDPDDASGLCDAGERVDGPASNLTSPIPGDPETKPATAGCSYCYGNARAATSSGLPGLADAVVSGLGGALDAANTDHLALLLDNDNDFGVTITVHAARPAFDPPGAQIEIRDASGALATCATPGVSKVTVKGAGFGPPGACLAAGLTSCPLRGPPAPGYALELEAATGGTLVPPGLLWSDGAIEFTYPPGARAGRVRVGTPLGTVGSADQIAPCARARVAHLVAGGGVASGGGITARIEIGHGLGRTTATGANITLRSGTAVHPAVP
jgi:hypothetical protein